MKCVFAILALCVGSAPAVACPNLTGHYLIQNENATIHIDVRQWGCDRVEITRSQTYQDVGWVDTDLIIVDGNPHGAARTIGNWLGNRLRVGAVSNQNHVDYRSDSSRNLLIYEGPSKPECGGPCVTIAKRMD